MNARAPLFIRMAVAAGLVTWGFSPAFAGSFEVAPTTLTLQAAAAPAVFYITNHEPQPIIVQIEEFAWQQKDTIDQLEHASGLIISPPMVRLMPNQKQTVRLMARADASTPGERAFRLVVSEIPDPSFPLPRGKIDMLLQFSMPVFVNDGKEASPSLEWKAAVSPNGLILKAQNLGDAHAKVSDIVLETPDGRQMSVDDGKFRYILGKASFSWAIQPKLEPGQPVRLHFFDEIADTDVTTTLLIK